MNKMMCFIIVFFLFFNIRALPNGYNRKKSIINFLNIVKVNKTGFFRSYTPHTSKLFIDYTTLNDIKIMRRNEGYFDYEGFLYDNCLSLIALMDNGKLREARNILKVLNDNFIIKKNGKLGLFNSYNIKDFDLFFPTTAGVKNRLVMGIDGDKIFLGSNMFVGLAAQKYFFKAGSTEFVDFVITIFKWVQTLNHFKWPNMRIGGPVMSNRFSLESIFSTENIINYYSFINNMINMYFSKNPGVYRKYKKARITLKKLLKIKKNLDYWIKYYLFNSRGTFNRGGRLPILKDGRLVYTIDSAEALDANVWAILGLGIKNLIDIGINPFKLIKRIENKFYVKISNINGYNFDGFDFTTKRYYIKKRSFKLIWWEGTAGMALAYKLLSDYAYKKNMRKTSIKLKNRYKHYINEMNRFSKIVMKNKFNGLSYIHKKINEKELIFPFDDSWPVVRGDRKSPRLLSTSTTVWYYLATVGKNPFNAAQK